MVWLTGSALVVSLGMILGLLVWIGSRGLPTFWPSRIIETVVDSGRSRVVVLGEVTREEEYELRESDLIPASEGVQAAMRRALDADRRVSRRLVLTGNADLFGSRFRWVEKVREVKSDRFPRWAVRVDRREGGPFFGYPTASAELFPVPSGWSDAEHSQASVRLLAAPTGGGDAARAEWIAEALRRVDRSDGAEPALYVRRRVESGVTTVLIPPEGLGDGDAVEAVARVWWGAEPAFGRFEDWHDGVRDLVAESQRLQGGEIAELADEVEDLRLERRTVGRRNDVDPLWLDVHDTLIRYRGEGQVESAERTRQRLERLEREFGYRRPSETVLAQLEELESSELQLRRELEDLASRDRSIRREASRFVIQFETSDQDVSAVVEIGEIVRAFPANQIGAGRQLSIYLDRWWEFLTDEPRESNREGGVFPAIFGTVMMSLFMCLAVVPFGVLAALYLREYAKSGPIVSLIRIAVNNLAGVPSIVFGVFGLGFFCYIVGAGIDDLLYESRLPSPTFGSGGLLWASFTLALMTAPVVIVATEEALSAVPNSMREGSYACGASKWQTIRRIVLPRALPGILTGAILAMARGAGEVAPLMLVGAVKVAPELPIAAEAPFGLNRSFMHLGYHIFDLGFKSPDSEAAKPMVFTTTFLLITIIAILNLLAIWLRGRLRKKYESAAF
ncbi:MAG: phosphate ABC transporter permease PstA [Planctomycetota bacterium]